MGGMNPNVLNVYTEFDLDRNDDSEALALVLSAQDLRLEQAGVNQNDPRRMNRVTAFSVLSDPQRRSEYDQRLNSGIPTTWSDLQHLANFGTFPSNTWVPPQQTWQQPTQQQPYHYGDPTTTSGYNPFGSQVNAAMTGGTAFSTPTPANFYPGATPYQSNQPQAGTRFWMAFFDLMIAGIAAGTITGLLGVNEFGAWLLWAIISIAYVVGFESIMGATPVKKLMGYEVRDVNTHSRLSAGAALKRNWWKFVGIIPAGGLVTLIMAGVYGSSINAANQMRGAHDRLANAEVVRKS